MEEYLYEYINSNLDNNDNPCDLIPLCNFLNKKIDMILDEFEKTYQDYKLGKNDYGLSYYFQNYVKFLFNKNKFKNYDYIYSDNILTDFSIGISLNKLRHYIPNFLFIYGQDDNKIYKENTYNTYCFNKFLKKCNNINDLISILLQHENALFIAGYLYNFVYNSDQYLIREFLEPINITIYNIKEEKFITTCIKTKYVLIFHDLKNSYLNINNYKVNSDSKYDNYRIINNYNSKFICDTITFFNIILKSNKFKDNFDFIHKQFFLGLSDFDIIHKMHNYHHNIFIDYLTRERKTPYLPYLKSIIKFNGKFVLIGCGAVGRTVIPILFKLIDIPYKNLTIIDMVDNRSCIAEYIKNGVKFIKMKITKNNYEKTLYNLLNKGDMLLDLAYNIDTLDLLRWCNKNGVMFANTSVEEYEPYNGVETRDPRELTLYYRQNEIENDIFNWDNNNTTLIVDTGFNPGHVNVLVKKALVDIANYYPTKFNPILVNKYIKKNKYNKLAQLLDVQVIQISERDTQTSVIPKRTNEFVGTWSVEGLREEAMSLAEFTFGTHEKTIPDNSILYVDDYGHFMSLKSMGMNTLVRSYVPGNEINGFLIRHSESITIPKYLSVRKNNEIIYCPTAYYAYCPCDSTIASIHEFRMNDYKCDKIEDRILFDEIDNGYDAVGCLLLGPKFGSWWIGSILDIHETRQIMGSGYNATTLQVAIHFVSTIIYMIRNPNLGFMFADNLDHEYIMNICMNFMGDYISKSVDWDPLKSNNDFMVFGKNKPYEEDRYQFDTFLVKKNTYDINA